VSALPTDRVFVIVEAGVTNYGDPELARRQVDAAAAAGADAIKFQAWQTSELVSRRVAGRLSSQLGHDWFERLEERRLSEDDLRDVQLYAESRGVPFFTTAHDEASLRFVVDELDVPMLKVGSGESGNARFLRAVGATGRPVLISFGLQDEREARAAVETLLEAGASEVVAFHCVTMYPTPPELARLDRIALLREALGVPVGISDHSVGRHLAVAAVALGACAIEKHLTFDKTDPRSLDNPGALEPDEFVELVREVRGLEAALRPVSEERYIEAVASSKAWATQAIVAARTLEPGEVIGPADLSLKRPGLGGLPPSALDDILGKRLARRVEEDEQLLLDDLES
jgi:N,N'-diacetyllegionaminate synthase